MKREQEGGKIEGGQVFIFSEDVKNDGKIISSGMGAKTHIETKKYKGSGSVESHQMIKGGKWFSHWWFKFVLFPLSVALISGFLIFFFGWS